LSLPHFIHAAKASFPIAAMCRLFEVTTQGYYAYAKRPASARVSSDAELCNVVREVFSESRETYGSPRVLHALQRRGVGSRTSRTSGPIKAGLRRTQPASAVAQTLAFSTTPIAVANTPAPTTARASTATALALLRGVADVVEA